MIAVGDWGIKLSKMTKYANMISDQTLKDWEDDGGPVVTEGNTPALQAGEAGAVPAGSTTKLVKFLRDLADAHEWSDRVPLRSIHIKGLREAAARIEALEQRVREAREIITDLGKQKVGLMDEWYFIDRARAWHQKDST